MTTMYRVKEIFYTLQGEGYHSGRPAVFCRFSGCNLWNGHESGRANAKCQFCDTDFADTNGIRGDIYTAHALAATLSSLWPASHPGNRFCVLTGGEPALQLDQALVDALHQQQFEVAIETNGTLPLKAKVDWLCVSPKGNNPLALIQGDELKLVWPQPMHPVNPEDYLKLKFRHFYLQPLDLPGQNYQQACVDYCLQHPNWRLSLQTHKWLGIA